MCLPPSPNRVSPSHFFPLPKVIFLRQQELFLLFPWAKPHRSLLLCCSHAPPCCSQLCPLMMLIAWNLRTRIILRFCRSPKYLPWKCQSVMSDSQPHGCSLPGSSVHGILQARTLGSNLGLLHGRQIPYRLSHREALISGIVESKWTLIHVPLAVRAVPLRSHLPLLPDSLECT